MPVYKKVGKYQSKAKGPSVNVPKEKKQNEEGLKITSGYKTNNPLGILLNPLEPSSVVKSKSTGEYTFNGKINQPKNKVQTYYESQKRKYNGTPIVSLYDGTKLDDEDRKYLLNEQKIFDNNINEYNSGLELRKAEHDRRKAFNKAMSVETGEFRELSEEDNNKHFKASEDYKSANNNVYEQKEKVDEIKVQQAQQQRAYEEMVWREKEGANIVAKGRADKKHPSNFLDENGNLKPYLTQDEESAAMWYQMLTPAEREDVDFWWGYYGRNEASKRMSSIANAHLGERMKEASKENAGVRNVIAPATNIMANLTGGITYGSEVLEQGLKNARSGIPENVPEWSIGSQMQRLKEDSREAFINSDEGFVGKTKGLALDIANSYAPAAFGPAAPFVLAAQMGGDAAYQTAKKGGSNGQAIGMFLTNAPIGYFASKGVFDELFKGSWAISSATKKAIETGAKGAAFRAVAEVDGKHILKQGALEGLEELAENYAYTLSDCLINSDNSDMAIEYNNLMNTGNYTEEQARQMVLFNKIVKEPALSAAYGALMGGLMAGANITTSAVSGVVDARNNKGGTSYVYGGVEINDKTTAKDVLEQLNNRKTMQTEAVEGDAQYKVVTLPDGKKYVQADRQIITGKTPKEWGKNLENYINNEIRQGKDVVIPTEDGDALRITADTAWKIGDPKTISAVKSNAGVHADELISASKYNRLGKVGNRTGKRFQPDDFQINRAYFRDHDGQYYRIDFSVGIDAEGKTMYSISEPIKRQSPSPNGSSSKGGALMDGELPKYSLPQNGETVNSNDMQRDPNYSEDFKFDEEYAQGVLDAARAEIEAIPEATRKMMDFYSKFANVRFIVGDTDALAGKKAAGAYVNSSDVILLDFDTVQDSNEVARKIVNHELTHSAERSRHYDALKEYAFSHMFNESNTKDSAIAKKIDRYGKRGVPLDKNGAEAELVAEYMGKLMSSPEAVNKMVMENKPLAKSVLDSLVETYKKVTTYFKDKEAYETRYALSDIEQGIRLFEKALKTRTSVSDAIARGMGIDTRAMGESDGVQYTFTPKVDGDIVTKAEKMEAEGKDQREIWKTLKVGRGLDGEWRREIDDSGAIFSRKGDLGFAESNSDYKEYKELYDAKARNALGLEGGRVLNTIEEQRYEKLKTIWGNTFKKNGRITEDANMQDKLSAYLKHDELYKEYPHLKDLTIVFDDTMEPGNWGQYNRQNKTITLNSKQSAAEMKATLLHEVMHAIQDYEGLARGSSVDYWKNNPKYKADNAKLAEAQTKLDNVISKFKNEWDDDINLNLAEKYVELENRWWHTKDTEESTAIERQMKEINDAAEENGWLDLIDEYYYAKHDVERAEHAEVINPYTLYRNTAGEIEARDVSKRLEMTDEQRLENFPESMVSNEDVVFADGEYAASEKIDGNGNKYWHIETGKDIFAGLKNDKDTLQKRAYQYFISNNKRFVIDGIIDGENLIFVADTGRKYVYGDHSNNLNDVEYAQKLRLLPSIYDLIEHANVSWSAPNVKSDSKSKLNKYKKDGLINYRGRVRIDNSYFNYVVRVGKSGIGKVMYEINLDADNATKVSDNNVASPTLKSTSNNYNLSQNNAIVKSDIQFSAPVADAEVKSENDIKISSKKAENYYNRYSNTAKKDIGKIFGIPKARLGAIDGGFDKLAGEYFKNGKISEESKNTLFEKAWKEGVIIDDTNTEFAKALRKDLKSSKLYISPDEAKDIPDFGVWRRGQIGNMYISTANGYPVDSKYSELSQQYPDLFPDDIIAPSDQLKRIAEVMERLKPLEYTLEEREAEFKDEYREKFKQGLGEFEKRLSDVSRYEKARELADVQNVHGRDELTVEEANNIYAELKNARKNYEKVMQKELLTLGDKKQVELVLSGDVEIENINPKRFNVEGIKKAVEARAPVDLLNGALDKHKKAVKARRFETAEKFLEGSDFWKEKKTGFSYARETMERTIYDIMGKGSEKKAKEFNDHYFAPVHEHEAQSIRNKNAYRQRVADLNLSDKITKGNTTSERFAVQFLGEIESDLERLSKFKANGIFNKKVGTKKRFATQQEVDRYVDYAYMYAYETNELGNKEFPKQNDGIVIGKIDDKIINELKDYTDIDLSEAYHVLRDNDVRHIKNSHGEGTSEKYPVTAEDLKQIPDIIKNYDDVLYVENGTKKGLFYVKRHNGVTYYLEAIRENGTILSNKQMIKVSTGTIPDVPGLREAINKKWNIDSGPNDSNVPRMYVQDVKNSNVPTDIVAQNKRVVNPIEKSRAQKILELRKQKEIFLRENPNLDYDKIYGAISEFRTIYDELFEKMNEARIRNGYAPVEYRQGYFPHFLTDGKKGIKPEVATELGIGEYESQGGIFEKFTKALGISTEVNNLPTNIAGKTQDFKPGIKFMSEALQRKTNETDYDAVAGFDRYIESVSDVIYHTDDIQELRALERQLRYEYSEAGVKERIDAIKDNALLPEDVKNEALDRLYERNITKHGGLAQELSEYTNLLANKKSKYDRNVESLLNRKVYNVLNWANKNVAGNMIAGNLSSAMTNFIPITQASAECSNLSIIKATKDTVKNFLKNDGFEGASTFLTNRKGSELLTKSTSTKISDVLSTPMEYADMFTANVVTRAKFYENIKNGMDVDEAIKDADRYAAGLIADRSKGSLPTVFGAKNPLFKTFTMFQVEVNNQLSYLGKDLPKAKRNKTLAAIAGALLKYFIGAYLFNDIYEKLVGRRPALDAIGFANEISGDFFGIKLPNTIDLVGELASGKLGTDDFKVEKKKPSEALGNIAANVAEDMPFVGGVMGGGRVPISSALPDAGELSKILDGDVSWKKKGGIALKEGGKLLYGVVPFGLNQVKKTAEGISAVKKGGSYSIDKEGNKQMQYPVYNDSKGETALNYAQAALFGKSALKEAQDWRKSGFKSMSVKDTERYNKIAEQGKRKDAHQTLNAIKKLEPEKDADGKTVESVSQKRYELIQNANIPEGQKAWLELSYWSDKAKERAEAAKKDADISNKQYVDAKYKYTQSDAEKYNQYLTNRQKKVFELTPEKEKAGDYKKFVLFNEEGLTVEQKRYLEKDLFRTNGKTDYTDKENFYLSLLSDSQNAKFKVTERALGVNAELYYTYLKIAGSGKRDEKMANLQKHGMNQAQANAFYELAIKNRKAGDVHDRTAYANMSLKEQAAYNLLKNYREYIGMDAAEFSVFVRAAASGRTEAEKIAILKNYSLNGEKLSDIAAKGIVRALAR